MSEFYDPMLYMSTPEHPNTMSVVVELKEAIDGTILREVVEELRVRFPYFYVKGVAEGNDLSAEPNPLPVTVRDTWDPINFNSPQSNYHLTAWKYEGSRMAMEMSHALSDGAGVIPYIKSTVYLYLCRKTGLALDPAGIRLPGDVIPESETGNPFAGLDIDGAKVPMYTKPPIEDFYRVKVEGAPEPQVHCIRIAESELIQYCRDFDGSPNAMIAVLLARAARAYDPDNEKTVTVSVAIDHKAMLGSRDNYRMFANIIELDFPKSRSLDDLLKSCTVARGQMMLQAQPENSLWAMKNRKLTYAKLGQLPLDVKLNVIAKSAGSARWTFSVSYVNSRSFGSVDPYLEAVYAIAEPGVFDIGCEIFCNNHNFVLSISQTFTADRFIELFLKELSSVGISYEVFRKEPLRMAGIEPFKSN
ncbi:hypothetical protein [Ruminococcus sp.]|uniref:hypothetical protein n=1 Tax=Ruminococcus sp. TaxID=41978 RepID=UPI002E7FD95F|nr:hypothetical protein [Ruminococcus sp.]MEE3493031.1 hypothetical protein [Ruminococcus sp.]